MVDLDVVCIFFLPEKDFMTHIISSFAVRLRLWFSCQTRTETDV